MLKDHIRHWTEWLRRVVTQPRSELTRWQRAARFAYDVGRFGARQLRQDKAPQMAGALAFRTLFGLLPVLVVATVLIRAFRGSEQLAAWLTDWFDTLGLSTLQVTGAEPGAVDGTTMSQWLLDLVSQAQAISFPAIGWVGLAILIYSAIALMSTIENCFNTIFRAPSGRPWTIRLPMYFFVLVMSPIVIGMTVFINARFESWIAEVETYQWLLRAAPAVWGFTVTWLMMFLVYRLVPSTNVSLRPALAGAFATAVLLEIGRRSLGAYLENLLTIRHLYGSLGLIPLFMFWVYVMWLVVLFGLEVAAILQMLGGRRLEEMERRDEPTGLIDPAATVFVMEIVAENFHAGAATSAREIAEATRIPERTVVRMLDRLADAGVVHRLDRGEHTVALARPPEQISAEELIDVGFAMVRTGDGGRHSVLLEKLRDAQRALAADTTLAGG